MEGVASTVQMDLTSSRRVAGQTDNGALGAVLADHSSSRSTGRQDNDRSRCLLVCRRYCRGRNRLCGLGGPGRQIAQLVEQWRVADGRLSQNTGLVHGADRLQWVCTFGRLSGQHDTIRAV